MILFQHRVRRSEQTERVCDVYAPSIPIRRATNMIRCGQQRPTKETVRKNKPAFECTCGRVLLKESETNRYQQKKKTPTHPHARTPGHPHTHTDTHTKTGTHVFKFLTFEKIWPEKNQLRVEKKQTNRQNKCCTTDKELHNLIRGTLADTRDTKEQELLDHCTTWRRSHLLDCSKNQQRISGRRVVLLTLGGSSSDRRMME